jgi:hypothetical protein
MKNGKAEFIFLYFSNVQSWVNALSSCRVVVVLTSQSASGEPMFILGFAEEQAPSR